MSAAQWLPDVALLVLKAAAILAIAMLLCALCRSATARARHSILAAALIVVGLLPLVAKIAPSWEISWPEALTAQTESSSGARQRSANHAADTSSLESTMLGRSAEPSNIDFTIPAPPDRQASLGAIRPGAVIGIWAVIASVLALRAFIAIAAARRIVNSSTQAPLMIQRMAERVATCVRLRRTPSMRVSERTQTPFLWGWRPVVVLREDGPSGDLSLRTGSGNLVFNAPGSAIGAATLGTDSGTIHLDAASSTDGLTMTTGSGNIEVVLHQDGPGGESSFTCASGNIKLDFPASAGGDIVMATVNGVVRVNGQNSASQFPGGALRTFSFDGAGPHHAATVSSGNITLNTHE